MLIYVGMTWGAQGRNGVSGRSAAGGGGQQLYDMLAGFGESELVAAGVHENLCRARYLVQQCLFPRLVCSFGCLHCVTQGGQAWGLPARQHPMSTGVMVTRNRASIYFMV